MICYGEPVELVPQMLEMISRKEGFWLTTTGYSMTPTLRHLTDRVYISPLERKAKKGDILLTTVRGEHCLLHRVVKRKEDMLYYKGDALNTIEGPLPSGDVIGIVTKVEHNGKVMLVHKYSYQISNGVRRRMTPCVRLLFRLFRKIKTTYFDTENRNL